jgi:hypothetical protein
LSTETRTPVGRKAPVPLVIRLPAILFPTRESVEIGKDCSCVLFGKTDLRHILMPGDHPVHDLCPQLLGREPGVYVTHRRQFFWVNVGSGMTALATCQVLPNSRGRGGRRPPSTTTTLPPDPRKLQRKCGPLTQGRGTFPFPRCGRSGSGSRRLRHWLDRLRCRYHLK